MNTRPSENIRQNRVGNLDTISVSQISGWYKNFSSQHPCTLLFYADGSLFAKVSAREERLDVASSGYADKECGFHAYIPDQLSETQRIEIIDSFDGSCVWDVDMELKKTKNNLMIGELPKTKRQIPLLEEEIGDVSQVSEINLIFDVSDLVYYIGHHDNLTGIQRVQSSVIQAMLQNNILQNQNIGFISYNAELKEFQSIDRRSFLSLLEDMSQPSSRRKVYFDKRKARIGELFSLGEFKLDPNIGKRTVISLLGAAWVISDYAHVIRNLKREYGIRFVPTFHDLIPVYAKDTCDQGTAEVFKVFLDQIIRIVDVALCVSENTAKDLSRYCTENVIVAPPTKVTRNGSSLEEFFPIVDVESHTNQSISRLIRDPYVIFVSTIEGRKNHLYTFRIWERLLSEGVKLPRVICVGRLGWRSEEFLHSLLRTDYLDGHFEIVEDISDSELKFLYENSLFSIYPSQYEGWGLPIGESLSYGKPCVLTDNSSLPEVAGEAGIYIPENDVQSASDIIRKLLEKPSLLLAATKKISKVFKPISWEDVAKDVVQGCRQAVEQSPMGIATTVNFGCEYSLRNLRVDTSNQMGQRMLDSLLKANKAKILQGQVEPLHKVIGLELREGPWYEPEDWGCWAQGRDARLCISFALDDISSGDITFYLAAQVPAQYLNSSVELKVSPYDNFGTRKISKIDGLYRWFLPAKTLKKRGRLLDDGNLQVSLTLSLTDVSKENKAELHKYESRDLGIGIHSMLFLKSEDCETRLNILENLFFENIR